MAQVVTKIEAVTTGTECIPISITEDGAILMTIDADTDTTTTTTSDSEVPVVTSTAAAAAAEGTVAATTTTAKEASKTTTTSATAASPSKPKPSTISTANPAKKKPTTTSESPVGGGAGAPPNRDCLLCGKAPVKLQIGRVWNKWKSDCGKSICSMLSLPTQPFLALMTYGPYCSSCSSTIRDIDFTMRQVSSLQKRLHYLQQQIEDTIGIHYRQLQDSVTQSVKRWTSSSGTPGGMNHGRDRQKRNDDRKKYRAVQMIVEELLKRPAVPSTQATTTAFPPSMGGSGSGRHNFSSQDPAGADNDSGSDYYEEITLPIPVKSVKKEKIEVNEGSLSDSAGVGSASRPSRKSSEACRQALKRSAGKAESKTDPASSSDDDTEYVAPADDHDDPNDYAECILGDLPEDGPEKRPKARSLTRRIHRKRALPKPPEEHRCDLCPFIASTKRGVEEHIRSKHPGTRYKCDICSNAETEYKTKSTLESHMKTMHKGEYSCYCKTCKKGFESQEELAEHQVIHSSQTPFMCSVCEEIFTNSKDLERHVLTHDNPYKCNLCFKCYTNDEDLQQHMKFHQRNVQCDICGLSCYSESRLRQHKLSHTNERKFQCEICSLSYKYKKGLLIHKRLHTGERPFVCKICEKPFYDSGHLKKHEEIHSGTRSYVCCICGKGFCAKQNLKQHELIHDTTKPKKKRAPRKPKHEVLVTHLLEEHQGESADLFAAEATHSNSTAEAVRSITSNTSTSSYYTLPAVAAAEGGDGGHFLPGVDVGSTTGEWHHHHHHQTVPRGHRGPIQTVLRHIGSEQQQQQQRDPLTIPLLGRQAGGKRVK